MINNNKLKTLAFATLALAGVLVSPLGALTAAPPPSAAKPFLRPNHVYVVRGPVILRSSEGKRASLPSAKAVHVYPGTICNWATGASHTFAWEARR